MQKVSSNRKCLQFPGVYRLFSASGLDSGLNHFPMNAAGNSRGVRMQARIGGGVARRAG
jgi:hypothetical protein